MRVVSLGVWVFVNLVFLGMSAYLYLLWVQYWRYVDANTFQPLVTNYTSATALHNKVREIEVRAGKPRFYSRRQEAGPPPPPPPSPPRSPTHAPNITTTTPMTREQLLKAIDRHKMDVMVRLRKEQMREGNILIKHKNKYGVNYKGPRIRGNPSKEQMLCAFRGASFRSLRDGDEPFTSQGVAKHFPSTGLLEGRYFNTCAVVTNAGAIKGAQLGNFIDSHDAVIRFNHAPTEGFQHDVGSRTTLRIVNSQVVTKPMFDFWGSPLYSGTALLVWDPSNYNASLEEWYTAPDFDFFPVYFRRRLMLPQEDMHLLHPASLWRVWDVIQRHTNTHVLPNPPSSGFLGIVLMLAHCETVSVVEFVPSLRQTEKCHYWDAFNNPMCTFGGWHPLATEKLLAFALNEATDEETFGKGYIRIPGFRSLTCSSQDPPR
ncbi:beta-galactoside alpha-2,6-sialyltransferase 1-like isoform X2 [Procambarus clarkii]|uniref:beta-galactoside alpha-2,6-sialyltransferase 1 n=1 Tax=Procambarus clarkii TaxID=6728 RepID=UPI001E67045D|nr:beta-galactoside alpha-2,6-sialyltransferase 1-like [Procambarus clarkii]XP_045609248.1 beta-galactoside alpha-2,6-sialyltransferase 1-like [Procambarus clarkii]